jgi:hypothetical protein
MNTVQTWLYLIGTRERANRLYRQVDLLTVPEPRENEPDPPTAKRCPTTILFGKEIANALYVDRRVRPALDAWDTGQITAADIKGFCTWIQRGYYAGEVFDPADTYVPVRSDSGREKRRNRDRGQRAETRV